MTNRTWITVIVLSTLGVIVTGQSSNQLACEDGWTHMPENDIPYSGLCIQINTEPKPWQEAEQHCTQQIATLMYLDRFYSYRNFVSQEERNKYISDLLQENKITEWWSGLHVANGRLMWHDYGPRLMRDYSTNNWKFATGQPNPDNGLCGQANSTTDAAERLTPLNVALADCSTSLPYICQKPPISPSVRQLDICPDGWYGHLLLPRCYRLSKNTLSYRQAAAACEADSATIAPAGTVFTNNFLYTVVSAFTQGDIEVTSSPVTVSIWIQNDGDPISECEALSMRNPALTTVSCDSALNYVCTLPTRYSGGEKMVVESPYLDQAELLQYRAFEPLTLTASLSRPLKIGEVVFVHTPTAIINSSASFEQWDLRDSFPSPQYLVQEIPSNTFTVQVTLPINQTPARRRRQVVGKVEDIFVDPRYVSWTTGYYSFSIYNMNPPSLIQTSPVLIRYSERYLYIYVMYMEVLESQTDALDDGMRHRTNLLGSDATMIRELASGLFNFEGESSSFRYLLEQIDGRTAKYRVFFVQSDLSEQLTLAGFTKSMEQKIQGYLDVFVSGSLKILSTVGCPFLQTTVDGFNLTFPATQPGSRVYSWERCYPENKARAIATCGTGGYDDGVTWVDFELTSGCGSVPQYNVSSSTTTLRNLSETEINPNNVLNVLNDTTSLTVPEVNLTEADIIYTADILYNYLTFNSSTQEAMESVFDILNNVLNADRASVDRAQKITIAANRIIRSVDDLTMSVARPGTSGFIKLARKLVVGQVWWQTGSGITVIGVNLEGGTGSEIDPALLDSVNTPTEVKTNQTNTAIYVDPSLVEGNETKLAFHIYGVTDLFGVLGSRFEVISKVAAARLIRAGQPIIELDDYYLTAVFQINKTDEVAICAYWDYGANQDAGGWNRTGCTTTILMTSGDYTTVTCKCNHLTNFAVLIDREAHTVSETDKLVLGIITKIGLILSIIGLGLTILTFLVFKHLRNGRGQQVLVNLSVAMLCSSVIFLVGIERTESHGGCIAVAALLHYFILVSFMWMLVEGILQYLRFVKVLGTYIPNFMKKTMIPAWGVPLIPVIVVLAVDYNLYFGGRNGYCWLSGNTIIYAFLIPVGLVMLINLIIFVLVLHNLCKRRNKSMVSNQSERKMARLHFQAAVSVFVILGLTWVFGFLAISSARLAFSYLFAILNAFQGLFIFLLFTFREKQIRKAWRRLCCRDRAYTSGKDSSQGDKHTNSDTHSTGLMSKSSHNTNNSSSSDGPVLFNNPEYRG